MTWAANDWVLALDDDPWALEVTRTFLEHHGIRVQTTQSEKGALDAIHRLGSPAVILLDVMMPGASGFEVCRRLRERGDLHHTRVVFTTALDDEASRLAALDAGADDLITKPFSEHLLVTRIRSLLELARLRDRDATRVAYETVLDAIGEGVLTIDENGRILTANRPACRLLGLPAHPYGSTGLFEFVAEHWRVEGGSLTGSFPVRLVRESHHPDQTTALAWTSRRLPDGTCGGPAWAIVVRDATDGWKRDRTFDRLVRTMNHKLRIPLTGVSTSLALLAEDETLPGDQRNLVDIAADSAQRLDGTLVRILEFTQALAIPSAAAGILGGGEDADLLDVDPDVEVTVDLAAPVRLDVELARRAIRELSSNARRAGALTLTLDVVSNPDTSVTFTMSDDGVGFPPAAATRIFEPFYQVDGTGEAEGAGLGLAILAAEVEARGGIVGAEHPAGGRPSVWFRLPATAASGAEAPVGPGE